jgi:hypothetical protein
MLMLSFTASGKLLPFQVIFGGKTDRSLPSPEVRAEAEEMGIQFDSSGKVNNHWSNLSCMKKVRLIQIMTLYGSYNIF